MYVVLKTNSLKNWFVADINESKKEGYIACQCDNQDQAMVMAGALRRLYPEAHIANAIKEGTKQ